MTKPIKELFCILWAVILTAGAITFVFGTVPMHVSWRTLGRSTYYLCYISLSLLAVRLGFVELGVALASLSLVIGLNNEALIRGQSYFASAALSIGSFVGLSFFGVWSWVTYSGFPFMERAQVYLERIISQLKLPQGSSELLASNDILAQFPSAIVLLLSVALVMALVFEKKMFSWLGLKVPVREPLCAFRVPDFMIWVFIVSLLGAFLKQSFVQQISVNVLNISVLVYFFQGLAIVSKYFEVLKVSFVWKTVITVLFVVYLPFLLSLIGVLDYWINFRGRLIRRAARIKERRGQ